MPPQGNVIKYVGVQRDLSGAKLREREMVAAQRLKAVGEMTGGTAHDLNNLLTAISGAAKLLALRLVDDADSLPLVEAIRGAAQRGTSQVRRLLGFTRTPLLARGPMALQPVLQQLALMLRRSLRDNISLSLDLHPAARWIERRTGATRISPADPGAQRAGRHGRCRGHPDHQPTRRRARPADGRAGGQRHRRRHGWADPRKGFLSSVAPPCACFDAVM